MSQPTPAERQTAKELDEIREHLAQAAERLAELMHILICVEQRLRTLDAPAAAADQEAAG